MAGVVYVGAGVEGGGVGGCWGVSIQACTCVFDELASVQFFFFSFSLVIH